MGFGEVWTRVGAQLVGQRAAGVFERGQRVGRPSRGGERADELRARTFPQRLRGDGLPQLGEDVLGPPERQPGLDVIVRRVGPQLLEPGGLGGGERRVGQVGERRPAPQRHRIAENGRRPRVLAVLQQRTAFARKGFEGGCVHFVRFDDQPVPGGGELDRCQVLQRRPQPGDLRLQGVRGAVRRVFAVHAVDQPLGRDESTGLQGEQRQQRPRPRAAHRHLRAVRAPRGDGPQHPESHGPSLEPAPTSESFHSKVVFGVGL